MIGQGLRNAFVKALRSQLGWKGSDDEKRTWQHDRAAGLLATIAQSGGTLSEKASQMVAELAARAGPDAVTLSPDDLLPGGVRTWYVREGDPSGFMDKEGAALVAALEAAGGDRRFGQSDHAAAFVRQQPQPTLSALLATPDSVTAHGDLWRQLLLRLSEDDAMQEASLVQKRAVLDALGRMQGPVLDAAGLAAIRWLEKCVVGRDETIEPFLSDHQAAILNACNTSPNTFCSPATLALTRNSARAMANVCSAKRTTHLPAKSPSSGLPCSTRARRAPDRFDEVARHTSDVEATLLRAVGTARRTVAARLTEWSHLAVVLMPQAAEELVLTPITSSEEGAALGLLDLYALYGRSLTDQLYGRLEAVMVREAKLTRLSTKGVAHLIARLVWRTLDRLAGVHEAALGPPALRATLQARRATKGAWPPPMPFGTGFCASHAMSGRGLGSASELF